MAGRSKGDNGQGNKKNLYYLSDPLPVQQLKGICGAKGANTRFIAEQLGITLLIREGRLAVEKTQADAIAKKDKGFTVRIQAIVAFLVRKVQADLGYRVVPDDIIAAIRHANGEVQQAASMLEYIPLTSSRLTAAHLSQLAGPDDLFLRKIGEAFSGLPLTIVKDRVVVDGGQLGALEAADSGLRTRLQIVMSALEALVLKGGVVSESTIEQAVKKAIEAQNIAMKDVAEMTRDGVQIEKTDIFPEELQDSPLLLPRVTLAAAKDSGEFVPTETLEFKKEGRAVQNLIVKNDRTHLAQIQDAAGGGVTIMNDGARLILRGAPAETALARQYLVAFAHLIAEKNYSKKDMLDGALACVLGKAPPEDLPAAREKKKGKGQSCEGSATEQRLKAVFADIKINTFSELTNNQRIFRDLLANNKNCIVFGVGPAGTGKTALAVQGALAKVQQYYMGVENAAPFTKIILCMPCVGTDGAKMAAVPGDDKQKSMGWFQTLYAPIAKAIAPVGPSGLPDLAKGEERLNILMEMKAIEILQFGHLRGKSIDNAIVIVDEAQNTRRGEMKTVLTRLGETSRMVLMGDVGQMDIQKPKKTDNTATELHDWAEIDEHGQVVITKSGCDVKLSIGHYQDVADFDIGTKPGIIERVYPYNGLAEALLVVGGDPHVAIARFGVRDIRRSEVVRNIVALYDGVRISGVNGTSTMPKGKGTKDPYTSYLEAGITREAVRPRGEESKKKATLHDLRPDRAAG